MYPYARQVRASPAAASTVDKARPPAASASSAVSPEGMVSVVTKTSTCYCSASAAIARFRTHRNTATARGQR
jgi:hypothetical protein